MNTQKQNRRSFLRITGAAALACALPLAATAAESAAKLRIGIIGSGRVGGALGATWAQAGHTVMFSSLDIEQDKKLAASVGPNARAGTPRERPRRSATYCWWPCPTARCRSSARISAT